MKLGQEFKEFISRGNVVDLAVGVIIGAAFTGIVNSLVNDIIMPFLNVFLKGIAFSDLIFTIGDAEIKYGAFIGQIINFFLIALVVFFVVKGINKLHIKKEVIVKPKHLCPYCKQPIEKDATRCPYCTSVIKDVAPKTTTARKLT